MSYTDPYNNAMSMISRILDREGGYVNNPADRGGITNFGISSRANPDVDVANLTRDGASDIYLERYFKPMQSSLQGLNPQAQEVAFDAAVNHGPGYAQQLVRESGGDANTMLQMRQQKYDGIVANDPSQAEFARGWTNRLDTMRDPRLSSGGQAGGGEVVQYQAERPQLQSATPMTDRLGHALEVAAAENPTPWRDAAQAFGASMQHAPGMGNRGFGGGLVAGLNAGSKFRAMERVRLTKAKLDLLEFNADQEYRTIKDAQMQANSDRSYGLNERRFGLEGEKFDYQKGKDEAEALRKQQRAGIYDGFESSAEYNTVANTLRDDATKQLSALNTVRDSYENVSAIYERRGERFDNWKGADDLALVFAYMKGLDPRSTVREGEAAQAGQVAGLPAALVGQYNSLVNGEGSLPKEAREQMFVNLNSEYGRRREEAMSLRDDWTKRAEFSKILPEHVLGSREWKMPTVFLSDEKKARFEKMRQQGIK